MGTKSVQFLHTNTAGALSVGSNEVYVLKKKKMPIKQAGCSIRGD